MSVNKYAILNSISNDDNDNDNTVFTTSNVEIDKVSWRARRNIEQNPAHKLDKKFESRPKRRTERKTEHRTESKPESKPESRPESRLKSRPEPRPEQIPVKKAVQILEKKPDNTIDVESKTKMVLTIPNLTKEFSRKEFGRKEFGRKEFGRKVFPKSSPKLDSPIYYGLNFSSDGILDELTGLPDTITKAVELKRNLTLKQITTIVKYDNMNMHGLCGEMFNIIHDRIQRNVKRYYIKIYHEGRIFSVSLYYWYDLFQIEKMIELTVFGS